MNNNENNVVTLPDPTVPQSLSDQDKMTLELSKVQLRLTQANAEKETARYESSSWAHKYLVLQLYVKYGLDLEKDGIDEQGNIVKNYSEKQK